MPSGGLVRGRALRRPVPPGQRATFTLTLAQRHPTPGDDVGAGEWIRWPDFWVPLDSSGAWRTLRATHARLGTDRVEVACGGGVGRTGTALAALAMFDGLSADEAITYVRQRYHPRAVETPWQRRWLRRRPE